MNAVALHDGWVRAIDLGSLGCWMDAKGLARGAIEAIEPIGGGTQNIMLRFARGDEDYVLRPPPLHKRPESDDAMRREMRVLGALAGSGVPHPELVAGEPDTGVLGSAFYLMRPVDGFNPASGLPAPYALDASRRHAMADALVDGIVALAGIDIDAAGLGDFGRADGWLERQTPRWRKQFASYAAFAGWDGSAFAEPIDTVCEWLDANRPATVRIGLLHGDYHFANVLFRRDEPALAAIVDWELANVGDPLLDLGWLIATWADGTHEPIVPVVPWEGIPPVAAIVTRYLSATGRSAGDAHWFGILACLKLGVLLEGTHARACAGLAPRTVGDRLHIQARALFARALHRIQTGNTDGL